MQLQNEFTVPAPVSEVWKTLLDVQRIAPCLPGATVDRVDGDEVAGRVKVKVGPITASYAGSARFVTRDEAEHRLVLQGTGRETRGSGTASATVEVRMSEEGSVTRVTVSTELDITGRQAQFGRGVMADVAGALTNQFAACLAEQIRSPGAPAAAPDGSGQDGSGQKAAPAQEPSAMPQSPAPQLAAAQTPSAQAPSAQAPEALDLVSTVVQPFAKQAAPVAAGLAAGLILGLLFGHRRRIELVIAPMPQKVVPRTRATL
jgi:carbon monoxide dehydrogenase subunit G